MPKPQPKKKKKKPAQEAAAEWVAVEALHPWVKNPRKNDHAVDRIADSIKQFGFGAPLLARKANGEIIAGHTRLKAAIKLGLDSVPVRYLNVTEAQAHALAIADNKLGEISSWVDALLSEVLDGLSTEMTEMPVLGFTEGELNRLLVDVNAIEPGKEEDQGRLDTRQPVLIITFDELTTRDEVKAQLEKLAKELSRKDGDILAEALDYYLSESEDDAADSAA